MEVEKINNSFLEAFEKFSPYYTIGDIGWKSYYLIIGYILLGEELSMKLYAIDKTIEGIKALERELKREIEVLKICNKVCSHKLLSGVSITK